MLAEKREKCREGREEAEASWENFLSWEGAGMITPSTVSPRFPFEESTLVLCLTLFKITVKKP